MHKRGTGVSNERILANAKKLSQENVDIIVRIPVIPSINAEEQNMVKTAEFLRDFPRLQYVELLSYHDLGVESTPVWVNLVNLQSLMYHRKNRWNPWQNLLRLLIFRDIRVKLIIFT